MPKQNNPQFIWKIQEIFFFLHKKGCTRQFESKLSLRSLALSLRNKKEWIWKIEYNCPLEKIKLAFAASCVEGAARKLGVPYIEVYEQIFTAYDKDWLDFIVGNRQGKNPAKDYDYIEGGIANDRVIDTVNLYITGFYETESALQQLAFHKPNNQICILNQDLLNKYLEYDGTKEI